MKLFDTNGKKDIYCFDTSAFASLNRTNNNVIRLPESLWTFLENMMKSGNIISHRVVFDEIYAKNNNDFLTKWFADKSQYFYGKTDFQVQQMSQIIAKFPGLIDSNSEREQADPWLIALAMEVSNNINLFGTNICIVVSQENQNSPQKIPAACKEFKVGHLSLREFFDKMGINAYINEQEVEDKKVLVSNSEMS